MPIKKKDFVEIEYTGKLADGTVFDTTLPEVAKKNNLEGTPKSIIMCIGEGMILKGIDDYVEGKELGKYEIKLSSDKAFGKKDAGLIKMVPIAKFREEKIEPYVGLQLNIDGAIGTIRNVSGGRILVDFNHPLSGKDVVYDVEVKRIVESPKEKVEALMEGIGIHAHTAEKEGKMIVGIHQKLPEEIEKQLKAKINDLSGAEISFEVSAHEEKPVSPVK